MAQKRLIKSINILNHERNVLEVELYYHKGGMNYFTSTNEKRGLYLSATPLTKRENSRVYTGFSGTKMLVKEMKRFNQKELDTFEPNIEDINMLVNSVKHKNNLQLEEAAS